MTTDIYTQRGIVAVTLVKMALRLGYEAGTGFDKEKPWSKVLYVQLPEGQMSWHFQENDFDLLEGLPEFKGEWDGTFNGHSSDFATGIKP